MTLSVLIGIRNVFVNVRHRQYLHVFVCQPRTYNNSSWKFSLLKMFVLALQWKLADLQTSEAIQVLRINHWEIMCKNIVFSPKEVRTHYAPYIRILYVNATVYIYIAYLYLSCTWVPILSTWTYGLLVTKCLLPREVFVVSKKHTICMISKVSK